MGWCHTPGSSVIGWAGSCGAAYHSGSVADRLVVGSEGRETVIAALDRGSLGGRELASEAGCHSCPFGVRRRVTRGRFGRSLAVGREDRCGVRLEVPCCREDSQVPGWG